MAGGSPEWRVLTGRITALTIALIRIAKGGDGFPSSENCDPKPRRVTAGRNIQCLNVPQKSGRGIRGREGK